MQLKVDSGKWKVINDLFTGCGYPALNFQLSTIRFQLYFIMGAGIPPKTFNFPLSTFN